MHILEIPSFFLPYGGLFCLDQAKALKALGHEVRILSNVQLGMTIGLKGYLTLPTNRYEHEMDGVMVYQSYQRGIPKVIKYNVERWVAIVVSMFKEYVQKYGRPDILNAHCCKWAGYAAMQISRDTGIPYVITENLAYLDYVTEFGNPPGDTWQIPLLKEAFQHAAKVLPVSSELVHDISGYFGTDYRWEIISNTIDVDYFQHQERPSLENRPFRFFCPAIFVHRKGYDILFAAYSQLRQHCKNVELHIAGRATDSEKCRKLMRHYGVEGEVVVHGETDKAGVRDILYQSDALVLATRSEVQPLSILEAMSTGIPVISTECIPNCLRIEGGCVIVPIDNSDAFAKAMQQVMQQTPIDGRTLSAKVAAIASPQVVGKKLESILSKILEHQEE